MSASLVSLSSPAPGGLRDVLARRDALADRAAELKAEARRTRDLIRRRGVKRKREPHREAVAESIARIIGGDEGSAVANDFLAASASAESRNSSLGDSASRPAPGPDSAAGAAESRRPRLRAPSGWAANRAAQKAAEKFCKERNLAKWVGDMNRETGLTPPAGYVWARWRAPAPIVIPDAPGAGGHTAPLGKPALQWLRRWRRRWGIRLAAARPGPRLSSETLRRKAGGKGRMRGAKSRPPDRQKCAPGGPVQGGQIGAPKLTPDSRVTLHVQGKMTPFFGPESGPISGVRNRRNSRNQGGCGDIQMGPLSRLAQGPRRDSVPHQYGRDLHEIVAGRHARLCGQAARRRTPDAPGAAGEHAGAARGSVMRRFCHR